MTEIKFFSFSTSITEYLSKHMIGAVFPVRLFKNKNFKFSIKYKNI